MTVPSDHLRTTAPGGGGRPRAGPGAGDGGLVGRYLALGLALGRHVDGLVDAYYGPPEIAVRARQGALCPPGVLIAEARRLLADLHSGMPLQGPGRGAAGDEERPVGAAGAPSGADSGRRRWLAAQVRGLETTARRVGGEPIGYADEVEACYGVRPQPVPEDVLAAAHHQLDEALPGTGPIGERLADWREAHAVPADRLSAAITSLAEELRRRTAAVIGLPDGEEVAFELVSQQPWSGFNWYHGGLRSTVAVNTDLPVLSLALPHLVAHEAYPGHHTEHSRKEVGLVRGRRWLEETIFLVGTPQCLLAEGLADLGLEVLAGPQHQVLASELFRPLGIRYDEEIAIRVAEASEVLASARANAAWRLHADGADVGTVTQELSRWALLPSARAAKAVEFLVHPTWRAYVTCYVDGLRLCRQYVAGDPARFVRLVSEQVVPADLST
ncbi:MAG: DUF885 domain-containing protein [Actinomycetota bacterium]|nr:DUF885 domain-containing protein [Actinomycetota bacterium]